MSVIKTIESKLEVIFKDLPPLSESTKEALAKVWPWLALVGGIVQLFAAYALYQLANYASRLIDVANTLSIYSTGISTGPTSFDKTVIYLGIVVLLVDAVILLLAFPKLQNRERAGWDLLFLAATLNLLYAFLQIFTYHRGIGGFIFSLLGSAVGFYLLFQVKQKFGGKSKSGASSPTAGQIK